MLFIKCWFTNTYDSYLPFRRLSSGILHDYYGGTLYRYYLQTSEKWLVTSMITLPALNLASWTLNFEPWTLNLEPWTLNFEPWTILEIDTFEAGGQLVSCRGRSGLTGRVLNGLWDGSIEPFRCQKSRWDGPFGAWFIAFAIRTHEFQVAKMSGKCGYCHRNERLSIPKEACERSNLMRFLPFSSSASSAQSVSKYHISLVISLLDELIMTSVTVTVVTVSVLGRYNFPILYIYTYISISYNIYIGDIVTQFF